MIVRDISNEVVTFFRERNVEPTRFGFTGNSYNIEKTKACAIGALRIKNSMSFIELSNSMKGIDGDRFLCGLSDGFEGLESANLSIDYANGFETGREIWTLSNQ